MSARPPSGVPLSSKTTAVHTPAASSSTTPTQAQTQTGTSLFTQHFSQPQSPTQYTPPHAPGYDTTEYHYKKNDYTNGGKQQQTTPSTTITMNTSKAAAPGATGSSTTEQQQSSLLPPRTKIICTIGPSVQSKDQLKNLLLAGMNVARMNFSHGEHAYHLQTIQNLREVMAETRRICAILLDTKGPEIRSCMLENHKEVYLPKDSKFDLHCEDDSMVGNATKVAVMYPNLTKVVKTDDHVLVDDGLIDLHVDSVDDSKKIVYTTVINSGMLGERKGVNLPGVAVDLPAVTQKDIADLKFGADQGVDFIAASFIRKALDVTTIRKVLSQSKGSNIKIISKIESQEGLDNFDEILSVSDGIMVARGDLGVEIPIEQVAIAQKMMIHKCNAAGKYVITATQMLESMIKNPSPTRAEATDVANAVLDGTDCVMLSGETAKGAYPIQAVQTMADICREAEANINHQATFNMIREHIKGNIVSVVEAIASSAVRATFDLNATMIICLTETGHTARLVAKYRPRAPIVTVTSNEQTARQCLVSRGLFPLLVGSMVGSDSLINRVLIAAQRLGMCKVGDMVVVTSGSREATSGTTNDVKIIQVGSVNI